MCAHCHRVPRGPSQAQPPTAFTLPISWGVSSTRPLLPAGWLFFTQRAEQTS